MHGSASQHARELHLRRAEDTDISENDRQQHDESITCLYLALAKHKTLFKSKQSRGPWPGSQLSHRLVVCVFPQELSLT